MAADGFAHTIRVRYGECDQQGVVFNAHYLAYVDDTIEQWMRALLGSVYLNGFDIMLKKATVEWTSPARHLDDLVCVPAVSRWGTTSFDVTVDGMVGDRHVFTATILYVSVRPGTHEPVPVPDGVKVALAPSSRSSTG